MTAQARAFWLREPGRGEIRPVALPEPGPGRGAGAHAALRREPRHRDAGLPRRRARRASTPRCGRRSRRATSRVRSSTATSTSASSRTGPPTLAGRTVFCLYPHQTRLRRAGRRGDVGARRRAAGPRRARRHGRDRRQRPVGRRAAGRRPGHRRRRRAWSAAASRGCSAGIPGVEVTAGRRRRRRGRTVAAALGVGFAPPGGRRRRPRPGRARQRDRGRAAAVARPARAGGHRARPELVRRPAGHAVARRRVPLRPAARSAPARSARWRRPGAGRRTDGRPAARSRSTCCATRPSTRCSPAARRSRSCPT